MNISDPIRANARLNPYAPAILNLGQVLTYAQLDATVDAIAARLLGLGLGPGRAAGTVMSMSYTQLLFVLALARIGATAVTAREVVLGVGGVKMDAVFADAAAAEGLPQVTVVDESWWQAPAAAAAVKRGPGVAMHPGGKAVCLIVGSSGTTGVPKAVALSHDLMQARIEHKWLGNRAPDHARQICAIGLEMYYGMSLVLRTLWTGGLVATAIAWDDIPVAIPLYGINYIAASPAQLGRMLQSFPPEARPFRSMELVEVGGSALPARLAAQVRAQIGGELRVSYGATELGSVASGSLDLLAGRTGAVGWIRPGVEVQAVDDADKPLPPGSEGRIRIRNPTMVDGYLGDPQAAAASFRDGWFYPDDIGSVGADGVLSIAGRVGEVFNAGGVKVSPRHIEDVALQVEDIAEAAAFTAANGAGVQEVWLAIVQKRPVNMDALHRHLADKLGNGAPRMVLIAEKLPRNAMGKVPQEALAQMAANARKM